MKLMTRFTLYVGVAIGGFACTMQPAYKPAHIDPQPWSISDATGDPLYGPWWTHLNDPAIDHLINRALANNPTIVKALARIDEARAEVSIAKAGFYPRVDAEVSGSREDEEEPPSTRGAFATSFSWELDLFGRIRALKKAAENRLAARQMESRVVRIALAAHITEAVINYRATQRHIRRLNREIHSRETSIDLMSKRLEAGFATISELSSMIRDLENTEVLRISLIETQTYTLNALVFLSGTTRQEVAQTLATSSAEDVPEPPVIFPTLKAELLMHHPAIVAANKEAEAAWHEISVARADRFPKLSLKALFSSNWIRVGGSTIDFSTWALGAAMKGSLFDGKKSTSTINAAVARYEQTASDLEHAIRATIRDIENALAKGLSAQERLWSSRAAETAAQSVISAYDLQFLHGTISLLELEDARRQLSIAESNVIQTKQDRALAWVLLVKASAGAVVEQGPERKPND